MGFFELDDVFGYQDANKMRTLWAADSPPSDPGEGEVWLDTNTTPCRLKRYVNSLWETISAVPTGTVEPTPGVGYNDSMDGQLFLNTATTPPKLKRYNAGAWEEAVGYPYIRDGQDDTFSGTLTSTIGSRAAVKFDSVDSNISIHDGYGNINYRCGVDDYNLITTVDGGSRFNMSHAGAINFYISTSAVGNAFTVGNYLAVTSTGVNLYGTAVADDEICIPTSAPSVLENGSLWIE